MWRAPGIELMMAYVGFSALDCTYWPSFTNECFQRSGPLVCSLYLGVLSWLLYVLSYLGKKSLLFQGIGLFHFRASGGVSIFIIGAEDQHAVYYSVTTRQLVPMRRYVQDRDHLGLEETAVDVLKAPASIWDGWSHSDFILIPVVAKKRICVTCVDGLLFEIRALSNKSCVLVSNREYSATWLHLGNKVVSHYALHYPRNPLLYFFSRRFLIIYLIIYYLHSKSCWIRQSLWNWGQSQTRSIYYHHPGMRA